MKAARRSRSTKHPGAWFAIGATSAWLGGFLADFARDTTPSHNNSTEGALASQILGTLLMGGFLTEIFAGWIAIRRLRRSWPAVPFALPLLLGLLQLLPIILGALLDPLLNHSLVLLGVILSGVFLGPILAAEVMLRWASYSDTPCPPRGFMA